MKLRANGMTRLPDGSGFCVVEIDTKAKPGNPIKWNPWNRVVQDHRDGTIRHDLTNQARAKRGLPVPWTPEIATAEIEAAPVF